jgi:hypothetical protein
MAGSHGWADETPSADRRRGLRRADDRAGLQRARVGSAAAAIGAICGGFAVLYLFFAAIGAVDVGDAAVATAIALALGAVWLGFFVYRARTGALRVQRPDRERRGF